MIQLNPRYWQILKEGSDRQREAYEILVATDIFQILKPFDPAHVGTLANDIDVSGSDIDIICSTDDLDTLASLLTESFSSYSPLSVDISAKGETRRLIAQIPTRIPIEVYAESTPVNEQLAYRHYLVACRVLDLFGETAHEEIRRLKAEGLKTEPAFAEYLGLSGDPYQAMLKLEQMSDPVIRLLRASRLNQSSPLS